MTIYHKTKHFTVIIIINVFRRFLSDTHVRYPIIKDIIFPVTSEIAPKSAKESYNP